MHTIREWWRQMAATDRREMDERATHLQLLAYRDAAMAAVAALMGLFVLQPAVLRRVDDPWTRPVFVFLPFAALVVVSLVFHVSWRLRSGGFESRVAAFRAATLMAGMSVAYGIWALLSLAGLTRTGPSPGMFAGLLIAAVLLWLLYRRRDTSRNHR